MTQHLLNRADVRAMGQKMRCKAVAKHMRRNLFGINSNGHRPLAQHFENAHPCKRPPETREKDMPLSGVPAGECLARRLEIAAQRLPGRNPHRHETLFRALATTSNNIHLRDEVRKFKITEFAHAQSAPIKQFEKSSIPQIARRCPCHGRNQPNRHALVKYARQNPIALRRLQPLADIDRNVTGLLQMMKKLADGHTGSRTCRGSAVKRTQNLQVVRNILSDDIPRDLLVPGVQKSGERVDIAAVGLQRPRGQSPLQRQRRAKRRDAFLQGRHLKPPFPRNYLRFAPIDSGVTPFAVKPAWAIAISMFFLAICMES